MKLKVCGMRDAENMAAVATLKPDFMGFIFYAKSPRSVIGKLEKEALERLPKEIQKVGVFVNANLEFIVSQVHEFGLTTVQLHGSESPEMCQVLQKKELIVIKVFSVDDNFDFKTTAPYEGTATYFLFDTKAPSGYGGHGVAFDWKTLKNYEGTTPFLLAGGIGIESIHALKKLNDSRLIGIDINSRFEILPAIKNVELIRSFKEKISITS